MKQGINYNVTMHNLQIQQLFAVYKTFVRYGY